MIYFFPLSCILSSHSNIDESSDHDRQTEWKLQQRIVHKYNPKKEDFAKRGKLLAMFSHATVPSNSKQFFLKKEKDRNRDRQATTFDHISTVFILECFTIKKKCQTIQKASISWYNQREEENKRQTKENQERIRQLPTEKKNESDSELSVRMKSNKATPFEYALVRKHCRPGEREEWVFQRNEQSHFALEYQERPSCGLTERVNNLMVTQEAHQQQSKDSSVDSIQIKGEWIQNTRKIETASKGK